MTVFSSHKNSQGVFATSSRTKHIYKRQNGIRRFFLLLATLLSLCSHHVSAQESDLKDGAIHYSIGMGYEWMSDAYSSKGFALDVRARFYMSGRMFCELMGHWGTHEGDKPIMQKGQPFRVHDERNCLLGAVGPGYELFQSKNQTFDVYIKGLIGYGVRSAEYDNYTPIGNEDGNITLGCEKNKKGIATVIGLGADTRFKRWTLTPSVDVFYIGNGWNIATMISFGFFL